MSESKDTTSSTVMDLPLDISRAEKGGDNNPAADLPNGNTTTPRRQSTEMLTDWLLFPLASMLGLALPLLATRVTLKFLDGKPLPAPQIGIMYNLLLLFFDYGFKVAVVYVGSRAVDFLNQKWDDAKRLHQNDDPENGEPGNIQGVLLDLGDPAMFLLGLLATHPVYAIDYYDCPEFGDCDLVQHLFSVPTCARIQWQWFNVLPQLPDIITFLIYVIVFRWLLGGMFRRMFRGEA